MATAVATDPAETLQGAAHPLTGAAYEPVLQLIGNACFVPLEKASPGILEFHTRMWRNTIQVEVALALPATGVPVVAPPYFCWARRSASP